MSNRVFIIIQRLFFATIFFYATKTSDSSALEAPHSTLNPRNVILVIGDGMGPQQIGLALAFAQRAQQKDLASLMLARAVAERLGAVWASPNHTSTPVFVFSQGYASEVFAKLLSTEKFGVILKQVVAH